MGITQTIPPTEMPVSLVEAKLHLRVDIANDDSVITRNIYAATSFMENQAGIQMVNASWAYTRAGFSDEMKLPITPLSSVSSIAYADVNNATKTLASSVYQVHTNEKPGLITLAYGQSWPDTIGIKNDVTITFVAGYGTAADVPYELKAACLLLVGHLYENRELSSTLTIKEVPMAFAALLSQYRMRGMP